jgi:hypothetical protein
MTTQYVNKWLGFDGGYITITGCENRIRVMRASKPKLYNVWVLKSIHGIKFHVKPGTVIEHAVRNETITLS